MLQILISPYFLILLWIGFVAFVAKYVKLTKQELVIGYDGEVERYYWLFSFIVFLPLIILAGSRSLWIGDTYAYWLSFNAMPNTLGEIGKYLETVDKDSTYYLLVSLLKVFITKDPRVYLWLIAIIQGLILVWFYRKFSNSYMLSLFLFVASADYIGWMYNGIRQFLAVTIVLLALPLLLKKKYILAILIILFASLLHLSTIIFLPMLLFLLGDAWNKRAVLFLVIILVAIAFLSQFTSIMDFALSDTQYNAVLENNEISKKGTNLFRVLVYSMPAIIALIGRKKIRLSNDRLIHFCTNASLITASLYLLSMFTGGVLWGRIPIICSLYNYILIPWEIENIVPSNYKQLFSFIMVVLYIIYYCFQLSVWGI